ncbi:MAG: hypothetical protein ACAI35_26895 [Candidatus Methylacidiphilales bacterium]|nr:hypothetical protein [Candidatus Methylacidiphilales bacterium]
MKATIPSLRDLMTASGGQTRLLYYSGFWDGPIDGLMLWENKTCFYCCHLGKEDEDEHHRYYKVYALTDEEIKMELARHAVFVEYVGSHCDFDQNGAAKNVSPVFKEGWKNFYNSPDKSLSFDMLSRKDVIGEFKI